MKRFVASSLTHDIRCPDGLVHRHRVTMAKVTKYIITRKSIAQIRVVDGPCRMVWENHISRSNRLTLTMWTVAKLKTLWRFCFCVTKTRTKIEGKIRTYAPERNEAINGRCEWYVTDELMENEWSEWMWAVNGMDENKKQPSKKPEMRNLTEWIQYIVVEYNVHTPCASTHPNTDSWIQTLYKLWLGAVELYV